MRRNLLCSPHVHVVLELYFIWKTSVPFTLNMLMLLKVLETATLAGSADVSGEMKRVLAEKNQLQQELQRCLQETHQKDLHFQQLHSKVTTAGILNTSCGSELIPAQKCCVIESQSDLDSSTHPCWLRLEVTNSMSVLFFHQAFLTSCLTERGLLEPAF